MRRQGTKAGEAGTVTTESALVLLVLLLFLLLSPAIWRIWISENAARAEAHRDMVRKAIQPLVDHEHAAPPPPGRHSPPRFPVEPDIEPLPPDDLRGYRDFPNRYVQGWTRLQVRYSSGWRGFRGDASVSRYGAVMRSPWTWMGWYAVPTQTWRAEPASIRAWFRKAYEETLDDRTVDALKLDKDPLE